MRTVRHTQALKACRELCVRIEMAYKAWTDATLRGKIGKYVCLAVYCKLGLIAEGDTLQGSCDRV